MPSSSFVHLRLHSEYSLVDGLISINPLVDRALELSMPAVALTDITNFFGLIKFAAGKVILVKLSQQEIILRLSHFYRNG